MTLPGILDAEVILLDGVQFMDHIPLAIEALLRRGKVIYCSGLDIDYLGKPFKSVSYIASIADETNKFHAVCARCGEDAVFSAKLSIVQKE